MEKVCVMGLGYIGLPTASLLATKGFLVCGVDCLREVVDTINQGKIHFFEPDLDILVRSAVNSGLLKAGAQPEEADVFIIAVPTPFKDNHIPDLSYVEAATKAIASFIRPGNLVILESTSPVGTTEIIAEWIAKLRPELSIFGDTTKSGADQRVYFAHCPERVLPGQILRELIDNDRIVGGLNKESAQVAVQFYQKFVHGKIYITNARTAELAKLAENSFRDVNIAFANELSIICDSLEINVWELIELANRHPRVNILQPGPGVGGHCIAVDPWFIVDAAPDKARLIRTAREVNDYKSQHIVEKIRSYASKFRAPVIACLGLAFKPDVDDLRESPALEIVRELAEDGDITVLAVEPHIDRLPESIGSLNNIRFSDWSAAIRQADIIVLLVNHKVFMDINRELIQDKVIVDTRGMWR